LLRTSCRRAAAFPNEGSAVLQFSLQMILAPDSNSPFAIEDYAEEDWPSGVLRPHLPFLRVKITEVR